MHIYRSSNIPQIIRLEIFQLSISQIDFAVRLSGGNVPTEGRVEVYHRKEWGTISHNGWGINSAHVVCRSLGYGVATEAKSGAFFGPGSGTVWLDNVWCYGVESDLEKCNGGGNGWGGGIPLESQDRWYSITENIDQNHFSDASVICSESGNYILRM